MEWNLTKNPKAVTRTAFTSPYDRAFSQHLIHHGVFPMNYTYPHGGSPPQPDNLEDIQKVITTRRASLATISNSELQDISRKLTGPKTESQVGEAVSMLRSKREDPACTSGSIPLRNFAALTDGTLTPPNPDVYYGARPEQFDSNLQSLLGTLVIPSTDESKPILPTFFLALKSKRGTFEVAETQACYDGAFGARAIHALCSLIKGRHFYNNNAYTITAILVNGLLRVYSSHIFESRDPGRTTECALTRIGSWDCEDPKTCLQGIQAYRNLVEWTGKGRNEIIYEAGKKLRQLDPLRTLVHELITGFVRPPAQGPAQELQASGVNKARKRKRVAHDEGQGEQPRQKKIAPLGLSAPYDLRSRKKVAM